MQQSSEKKQELVKHRHEILLRIEWTKTQIQNLENEMDWLKGEYVRLGRVIEEEMN